MWRIPATGVKVMVKANDWREGERDIGRPLPVKVFENGEWHRSKLFHDGSHLTHGVKPIRQQGNDAENYDAAPTETVETTEIVRAWTNITPKMSVNNRKKVLDVFIKALGAGLVRTANYWINDYFGVFDANNPKKAEWQTYKVDLKAAYNTIKGEVLAISDYDDLIAYIKCEPDPLVDGWRKYLPDQPEPE